MLLLAASGRSSKSVCHPSHGCLSWMVASNIDPVLSIILILPAPPPSPCLQVRCVPPHPGDHGRGAGMGGGQAGSGVRGLVCLFTQLSDSCFAGCFHCALGPERCGCWRAVCEVLTSRRSRQAASGLDLLLCGCSQGDGFLRSPCVLPDPFHPATCSKHLPRSLQVEQVAEVCASPAHMRVLCTSCAHL